MKGQDDEQVRQKEWWNTKILPKIYKGWSKIMRWKKPKHHPHLGDKAYIQNSGDCYQPKKKQER